MHEEMPKARRERVFLRSLGSRVALLVLFSSFAVAGIAVGTAMDLREAVRRDADASAHRLAAVTALVHRRFIDDAQSALTSALAARQRPTADCDAAVAAVAASDPRILSLGVATPSGTVTCATASGRRPLSDDVRLTRAVASKSFAMGDYVLDPDADVPMIGFALPALEGDKVVAVAFVSFDVRGIGDGGLSSALPAGTGFGLIDGRGTMLLRHPEPDRWAGQPLPESALSSEILSRKDGAARLTGIDGTDRIYAFTKIEGLAAPGAYAYVGVPIAIAHADALAAATRAGIVAAFLTVVAIWAALTMGDILLLRRIRRLVETMRHVVLGDLAEREKLPRGLGELDDMTHVFDVVTKRLKEAYDKTELKVKTRTVELEFNKGMAELEKARTEALLASIGEGVVATDKDGKIIFFNKFASDMIGIDADLVGKSIYNVIKLQDEKNAPLEADARPTAKALATGKRVESPLPPKPYWMVHDNKPFPVHIIVTPIRHEDATIGAVAVFRDITDEMEIDRRKSEFISIASHQLRSPLTGIKWLADMLRKGDLGKLEEKQQKVADQLFDANERLVVLVNELLNVSRLEVGSTKPNPVETDMRALLDGIVSDTQPVVASKGQKLDYQAGDLPKMMIDPLLTREVVANILSNASKYSPDGSTVTLVAAREGDDVHISVADQGIGIPPADQKKMFQKFFRAENAAKSSITGTGLGLYVVKSVVELQGGKIWFDSTVGKGTTFHVTFPVKSSAKPPAAA